METGGIGLDWRHLFRSVTPSNAGLVEARDLGRFKPQFDELEGMDGCRESGTWGRIGRGRRAPLPSLGVACGGSCCSNLALEDVGLRFLFLLLVVRAMDFTDACHLADYGRLFRPARNRPHRGCS